MAVVVAAGVLGSVLGVVPGGLGSGVVEAQSLGAGGVSAHSRAFLHRTVIEEGQTRQFEISNLPDRPAYYVFFKPLAGYTAEASDVTFKVHWRRDGLVEVAPGKGHRASVNSLRERLRFEVEAHEDSPADSVDETFGVQLCTTADCEGGTVLGDWTVTITDVSDTTLTGTGASITVSGGSTTMMEQTTNNDNRDVADTITVTIPYASLPSQDLVVVGHVDTTTMAKLGTETPIANIAAGFAKHMEVGPATPRQAFVIDLERLDDLGNDNGTVEEAEWISEYEVPIAAFNNAVDTPGGMLSGNLVFTIYQYDSFYYDTTNCTVDLGLGDQTVKCPNTSTAPTEYTGIELPDVPLTVTDDDEVTEIELHHAATTDQVATEGSTSDTAKFRVTLGRESLGRESLGRESLARESLARELAAGETLTVPLAFQGAVLGTHFTLSLDGSPQGVAYADSADGETGELVFTGPSAAEATVVVTAATDDGDTVSNNLVVRTYPTSEPWKGNHITTNLAGGVCSGDGCGPGRLAERLYRITLNEARAGLAVIDNGGGRLLEDDIVENVPVVDSTQGSEVFYRIEERVVTEGGAYSYEVRLSAAPTSNVTVAVSSSDTTKATITTGSSLTFTQSNWAMPQTVTVTAVDNNADSADIGLTITHAVTGAGNYASIGDVIHPLTLVDDDPTEVTMAGAGMRTSDSGTEISEVMVEGDATRVDRSLTISLGRALTAGEWVRVPLYLEATGHRNNPDAECDLTLQDWTDIALERWADYVACDVVSSVRGPRYSANVAWPVHHNDFQMAAVGTGVSVEAVNRYTPAHVGFRWLEFAGAGAQEATIVLKARGGFDDGDNHDEEFHISFPRGLQSVRNYTDDGKVFSPQRHLNPQTNLGGGVTAAQADVHAWYGIADDDAAPQSTGETVEVTLDWALLPSGVSVGDTFRLLYVTNGETAATSRLGSFYDDFARAEITGAQLKQGGVPELVPHAESFFGLVTTLGDPGQNNTNGANRRAQFRTDTGTHPDDPIYWVGGDKAADNKVDFTDGMWDSESPRHADGTAATVDTDGYWTGGGQDGHRTEQQTCTGGTPGNNRNQAGEPNVHVGKLDGNDNSRFSPLGPIKAQTPACSDAAPATEMRPIYALSTSVFEVTGGAVEITPRSRAAEGSAVSFTVTMSEAAPAGGITVPYTFDHGLGIATDPAHIVADNNDFTDTAGNVTIAEGATTATIAVATTNDSTYEGDHYFRVTLGTPTGTDAPGLAAGKHTGIGIITDKADLPALQFNTATATAAEDAGTIDVTVTKTGTTAVPLSMYWTTADDTAAHPTDYTAQSGYLEFATGDTTKTLTIPIVDDNTAENTETFKVQLDGTLAVDARVGSTGETTITLTDDDDGGAAAAALVFAGAEEDELAVSEESGHIDVYQVSLSKAPSADVVVAITAAAGAAVSPGSLTFTTTNWDAGQDVTVSGVDDNTINTGGARLVTISHGTSSSDNDFNALTGNVTVRVTDTDTTPTLGITPTQVQSSAFASGGTVTLTLTPEHVTFLRPFDLGGSDGGGRDGDGVGETDGDDLVNGASLTAAGLALLTFTGAPTGLTVDSAELGAVMSDVHGQPKHRSLEVVLSYSGSVITADDTVTLNVDKLLLRRSLSAKHARRYGASLSADFTIKAPGPVTVSMAGSDGDANGNAVEGTSGATGYRTITLTLGRALTGSEEVTVPLSVVGATVTDDYTFGLEPTTQTGVSLTTTGGTHTAQDPAVVFSARASSATLRLAPVDNSVRSQPYVVVGYGTGARAPAGSGVTLDTPTGGPVGVVLVDDETGDFEVAADWPLLPSGLSGGDEFRLMFITSQTRTAESTDIDVYNEWAQGVVAAGGHGGLKPYAGLVRVVGSTTDVDARVNAGMHTGSAWADGSANASSSGVAVYWLAEPSSDKVADNYFDFFDGSWDGGAVQSGADTVESGAARTVTAGFWTGSINDGRKDSIATRRLGATMPTTARVSFGNPLSDMSAMSDVSLPMLAMSPVFKVEAAATPELTFASAAYSVAEDGGSVDVTVNASSAPSAALTVNLDSQAETATEASDYTAPPTTFTFPAAMTSHTFSVNITDDNTVEGDETFTMTLASGTGYTVGMPATTTVTITDDDTPPVAVTMSASDGNSDGNAVEGGAGTTGYRTITLTLGRELAGSEQVTVPLSVVGATVATDFTFGLQPTTQTGVSLNTSGSNSAQNPAVVFASGATSATLRLTPVDNNVRTQPYVIVDYGTGSRAPTGSGGVTLDTPTGGPIGVVLVDDETGDIVLPAGAGFRPEVSANLEYRMIFMTSEGGPATSTDIADYDHFVRSVAIRNGGADLLPYVGFFKAFVSTASVDGREHVGIWDPSANGGSGGYADGSTAPLGVTSWIYWLGGQGVARNAYSLCNAPWTGRWSATATRLRHEDGSEGDGAKVWTGMNNNCTTSSNQLGTSTPTYGPGAQAGSGGSMTQSDALSLSTEASSNTNRFYAVSEIVKSVASAAMPEVRFSMSSFSGNENSDYTMPHHRDGNRTARITVTASPAPAEDLVIPYDVNAQDAVDGEDFLAGRQTVTIPAGQTSVVFNAPILDDNKFEDSETFQIVIAASSSYLRGLRSAVVTILDDDAVEIGFEQPEFWVLEDSGTFDVNLTLSQQTEQQINLTLAFEGTATDGSDYTAPSTSVTIPSGNTSGTHTISIPITADNAQEADETIVVRIASSETPRATAARRDRTTLYIADQDHTSAGLVVPSTAAVREGGEATYWLRLATLPTGTVTVSISGQSASTLTLDADDSAGGDQGSVQFTTSNWYVGRKITVRGAHDADLTDDTVSLSHSASGADYGSVTGSVAATVDDEDVTLSIAGGTAVTEGTAAEFTVTASPAPDRDLFVLVTITDATGADFVAANVQGDRTRTLPAGQTSATFTVATVGDLNVERSGPITIALRTSDSYRIDSSAASAMVQVNDDDDQAVDVAMSASRDNAVEGAGDTTGYSDITLTLDGALTGAVTLTVPLTVTGATVTTDYTFGLVPAMQTGVTLDTSGPHSAQNPAVVFIAGATTATLRLTPVDNDVRTQPYVIVDFGSGAAASGGINVGAQTGGPIGVALVDDETGAIEVAADWALAPAGLSGGDEFRLIYLTSQPRNAESTDIDDYNSFAREVTAASGHAGLLPYAGLATVIASTATADARENTAMWDPSLNSNAGGYTDSSTSAPDSGTKVYWLAAPPANKVADNYFDFFDGGWDTGTDNRNYSTNETGTGATVRFWTGTSDTGEAVSGQALGESTPTVGNVHTASGTPIDNSTTFAKATDLPLLAISPVFTMAAAATGPVVSVRLMVGEGENRNSDGEVEKPESDEMVSFPLSLDTQPAGPLTVCVRVAESGDPDRVTMANEGIKTVSFLAGVQSGSIDVAWTDTMDDDLDSVITVTAVPSSTAGCTSTDSYTVSGTNGSDNVRITDDEVTQLSLSSSDMEMGEGDASDTATLTVSSGRALVVGESVVATIALASGTGARLPGHGTPDFAVSASGTGVVLSNAATATPRLTFTGSDSNTVQTATVTLTPVAAADDGDTSDEEITATLSVVSGTGSGTVVTGGGVEVASASSAVDLTIDDDEAAACSAQSSVLSVSDIRITEMGGEATYCVRLTTAPSGGSTTVTIGEAAGTAVFRPSTFTVIESVNSGAATISPSSLTFTTSNYTEPQQVTVTAVDEPGDNRNRRFNLTHTASGGGYSSQALGSLPVLVSDAPELEVFEYRRTYDEAAYNAHKRANGGWGIFRPNTLTSTPGLGPAPDITPGEVLDYFVRLSSQPVGDVTVTINVTDIPGYDADTFTGISFTRGGAPQQTLTFTFHHGDPTPAGCSDGRKGGDRYTQTRISWKCYRAIWVHNTRNSLNQEGTRCADVVHEAKGGGFRTATVDTIRAFSLGRVFAHNPKEFYPGVSIVVTGWWRVREPTYTYDNKTGKFHVDYTGTSEWQTRTLNNIAVYRDKDSGKYYDFVNYERGTRIWRMREVPSSAIGTGTVWDQSGPIVKADTLNLETVYSSTGQFDQPAGCPLLRRHYAIHHTPQNTPQNSPQNSPLPAQAAPAPTTAVANLALSEGDNSSVTVAWDPVPDASSYNVDYTAQSQDGTTHTAGFFDDITATSLTFEHGITSAATVTVTVTPGHNKADDTTQYHNDLAATATIDTGSSTQSVVPEITITAGADVIEGVDATFTITASPAPDAGLTVSVEITQSGDFATTGTQAVTIPTSGTQTLTVATTNDNTDEADGTITATVSDGTGYSVSSINGVASVAVADNDPPADCVSDKTLELARDYYELNRHRAPGYGKNWRRVLIAFGDLADAQLTPFTAAEARQSETRWAGWRPFREALECIEQARQTGKPAPPPVEPEITITAGADISEGDNATYTITAAPTPAAGLDVTIEITQSGDFASTGTLTVTIPSSGTYTLTVATTDDSTDEADGSVTATIADGTGYSVSSSDSAATVNVADDDDPPPVTPQITITAGTDVTEGTDATFTITAAPAPAAGLDVAIQITQSGDFALTGTQTITIPTTGTYTLTVATTNDSTDEADGTITATIDPGTGYTVSSSAGAAAVNVADDDVPHISIAAGADVTEGGDAVFTITADPAPHAALDVTVTVSQSGDHVATTGTRTVTIPTTGTYTLTVATTNDSTDEADGSITATIDPGTGYTVSSSSDTATVNVSDDDDPPADDTTDTSDTATSGGAPAPTGPLTLTVADATATEGDSQGLRFVATLSRASDREIKLGYGAFDTTAQYNQDYTIPYRFYTIKPGETQVEIIIPVVDDNVAESDETLAMYAYESTFTTILGFAYATGTIKDND